MDDSTFGWPSLSWCLLSVLCFSGGSALFTYFVDSSCFEGSSEFSESLLSMSLMARLRRACLCENIKPGLVAGDDEVFEVTLLALWRPTWPDEDLDPEELEPTC